MSHSQAGNLHMLASLQTAMSGDLFENLIENFPDIIHSVNREGHIVSTNRKATELLGYSRDELIGMEIFDLYDPSIRDRVKKGFESLKTSGFNSAVESRLISKSGELIDVEIRSISLYDTENKFDRTFSIIRDIREKKAIQSQLYQQSKLAGIGELAAGIIHDIRNPLAVIKGFTRAGIDRVIASDSVAGLVNVQGKILKASDRIDRLCSHLRDYMRQEHEIAADTNLKALVEDALLICENRATMAGAKIVNKVTDPELFAHIAGNSIEQVLINIISNACDAVGESEVKEVRISCENKSKELRFFIEDSGPGIPEKIQEKIFESFYTTKPKGKGTGLGLSICAGIVNEHGGKLSIDKSYKQGARFVVFVPLK